MRNYSLAMTPLVVFVSLLFLFSLVSRRLEQTIVTAPIVFTVAGMLMFPVGSQKSPSACESIQQHPDTV